MYLANISGFEAYISQISDKSA